MPKRTPKMEPTDKWLARLHKRIVDHQAAMFEWRNPPAWVVYRYHRDYGVAVNRRNPLYERKN